MQETKDRVRVFLEERLPFEYEICRVGLDKVIKKTWEIINNGSSEKTKLLALSLAKDCYHTRMQLMDSKVEIDQAMQLVVQFKEEQRQITLRAMQQQFDPGPLTMHSAIANSN